VITDGEQRKYPDFWTCCVHRLPNTAPDGSQIPFVAGHVRRMPRLTGGPFRYQTCADDYFDVALRHAHRPVKPLGTGDDCGFSPFAGDTTTSRDTAFATIRARVEGARCASETIQGR
jgi:hypothetical protein